MENEMELIERCVAYHKGQSSATERNLLEKLVSENTKAKKHFEESKLLEENIRLYHWQKDAKAVFTRKRKSPFIRMELLVPMAASLLLISLLTYLSFSKSVLPEITQDDMVLRGTSSEKQVEISEQEMAFQMYLEGNDAKEFGNYNLAIESYKEALKPNNIREYLKEAVKWNLCLAYLYNGQEQEAEAYFDELMLLENPKYSIGFWNERKIKAQILRQSIF